MAAYEVWYKLLVQPALTVYSVKSFEIFEPAERRFAHRVQHISEYKPAQLQTAADMFEMSFGRSDAIFRLHRSCIA